MDTEKLDESRKPDDILAVPILRQQDSSFGSVHHTHSHSSHGTAKGRHKKPLRQTAILRKPLRDDTGPWVKPEHEATEWLSLFYDLVMVAVLTVFSNAHELSAPKAIPAFFSYFVIIYWIWVSQTHYDTRYQSDDALHILMKFCQISVFIYIGAASGNWSPFSLPMEPIDRLMDEDPITSSVAEDIRESFKTVVFAYIGSRLLLAFQYGVTAIMGRRSGRTTKQFALSISTLLLSTGLALAAVLIPLTSDKAALAKIVLFYVGVAIEVAVFFVQIYLTWHINPASHKVAERYAALTLILLGEGFISLTRAFKQAISGLSDRDTSTYAQVFLSIAIIFLLWGFLFSRFHKDDDVSHRRRLAWEIIHFPLAFGLLLFLGSMINTVLVVGAGNGTDLVLGQFSTTLAKAIAGTVTPAETAQAARYLDKLTLSPPFETELHILRDMATDKAATENATIVAAQYLAQIIVQSVNTYGLEVNEHVAHLYEELVSIDPTQSDNIFQMDLTLYKVVLLAEEIVDELFNGLVSGVTWLYPTAGAVLLLCAIRSMLWYRFQGIGHVIIHSFQIGAGLILCMLGMLNIGKGHAEFALSDQPGWLKTVNPMFRLAVSDLPLVIVMVIYFVTYLGSTCALLWAHKRRGDVYIRDGEEETMSVE